MSFKESFKENKITYIIFGLMLLWCILSIVHDIVENNKTIEEHDYVFSYWNEDDQEILHVSNFTKRYGVVKVSIPDKWLDHETCRVVMNKDMFIEYEGSYYYNKIIKYYDSIEDIIYSISCDDEKIDTFEYRYEFDLDYSDDVKVEVIETNQIKNLFDIIDKPIETALYNGNSINEEIKELVQKYGMDEDESLIPKVKIIEITNEKPRIKCDSNIADDYIPVYMCFDSDIDTLYFYTEANKIYVNEYSNSMFADLNNLEEIKGFEKLDFSNVSYMSYMFSKTNLKSLDFSSINLENVKNISGLFYKSNIDNLFFANIKIPHVDSLSYVYAGLTTHEIDLCSNLIDTKHINDMSHMFSDSEIDTVKLCFDTSNVNNTSFMFYYSKINNLELSDFNLSNLTKASYMFKGSSIETLDLSKFVFPNLVGKDFDSMFSGMRNLKTLDISSIDYDDFVDIKTSEPDRETVENFFKGIEKEVKIIVKDEKVKTLIKVYCPDLKDNNIEIKK